MGDRPMKITLEGGGIRQGHLIGIVTRALVNAGFEVVEYGPDGIITHKPRWATFGKVEVVVRDPR
jgi:hypothetical protein